jgi:D-ribose pyranase
MKDRGILHPQLARVTAEMGHGDLLGIADAGFPIPLGVERVDLALAQGKPGFLDVVTAVLEELRVEAYVLAGVSKDACPEYVLAIEQALLGAEPVWVDHEELKRQSRGARAIVRTGEFTPYANVLLRSGVEFRRS